MYKIKIILTLLASLSFPVFAQSSGTIPASAVTAPAPVVTTPAPAFTTATPASVEHESGFLSYIDFGGSSNSSGHIFQLGLSAGYQFNERVSVDAHMPFYFVSATTTGTGGTTQQTTLSSHGVGDPSFSLLLRFPNPKLDYKTRVTTWVPVANLSTGFTTGSVLVDWTNRFSHPVGRLLSFGQVDIANTVPDTPLFLLPYTAQGFNARFEAGTKVALTRIFSAGGSLYYVLPSGQQHLYSREVHDSGTESGGSDNHDGFMTQHVTVGNDLTRDHGFSTWLTASLPHFVDLEIGFTRSYGYNLNTVSFGVGFDPVEALRRRHEPQ
jgi:hypothetical protein